MDQAITRASGAVPRAVGEFQGYVDGVGCIEPSVRWLDRTNMPQVGDRLLAIPARAAVPRSWSILLTSANHGTVGPVGSTFPHAGEKHERVQVVEIVEAGAPPAPGTDLGGLVRVTIDGTVIPLAASSAPVGASTVLTDERIAQIWHGGSGTDYKAFARAIEREVAAQAGQVAVPEAVIQAARAIRDEQAAGCAVDPLLALREMARDGEESLVSSRLLVNLLESLAAAPAAPAQAKPLPAAEVPAPAAPKQCWSLNDEGFSHDSLSELLDNYPDLKAGARVFTGMAVYPALSRLIDSDDVIDQMSDRAYDIAGEYADGYPDVSAEDKAELDALLEGWIKKACPPDFYEVRDVHTYVITEQDIAAQASTAGGRQEGGA